MVSLDTHLYISIFYGNYSFNLQKYIRNKRNIETFEEYCYVVIHFLSLYNELGFLLLRYSLIIVNIKLLMLLSSNSAISSNSLNTDLGIVTGILVFSFLIKLITTYGKS